MRTRLPAAVPSQIVPSGDSASESPLDVSIPALFHATAVLAPGASQSSPDSVLAHSRPRLSLSVAHCTSSLRPSAMVSASQRSCPTPALQPVPHRAYPQRPSRSKQR